MFQGHGIEIACKKKIVEKIIHSVAHNKAKRYGVKQLCVTCLAV